VRDLPTDPWVLGYHVLNVREATAQAASQHGSIAVQQVSDVAEGGVFKNYKPNSVCIS
jgi:hypothetical protein